MDDFLINRKNYLNKNIDDSYFNLIKNTRNFFKSIVVLLIIF